MGRVTLPLILAVGMLCSAAADDFEALTKNSPFGIDESRVSQGSGAEENQSRGRPTVAEVYELRGVIIGVDVSIFNVYVADRNKFYWIKLGESVDGITVDSFDAESQTLYFHTPDNASRSARFKHVTDDIRKLGIAI
jgi:hypothetical protein